MTKGSDSQSESRADAYYAALVDAWFENRMEGDRTFLALSAGGLALLVTLLTAFGVRSAVELGLYVLASAAFVICIFAGVTIFRQNSRYLEREKAAFEGGRAPEGPDKVLKRLDRAVAISFGAGVLLTVVVAVVSAWPKDGVTMFKDNSKTRVDGVVIKKSVEGVTVMRPGVAPVDGSSKPEPKPVAGTPATAEGGGSNQGSPDGTNKPERG